MPISLGFGGKLNNSIEQIISTPILVQEVEFDRASNVAEACQLITNGS